MKRTENPRDPKWRLAVFRHAMGSFSAALVLSALISGAYGSRVYFTFAASAAGVLLWGRAWHGYLRLKDPNKAPAAKPRVPYVLRAAKPKRARKPAFLMNSEDFDDDLTRFTLTGEEAFTDAQRLKVKAVSDLFSGALMILLSFVI